VLRLDLTENPALLKKLLRGEITPEKLALQDSADRATDAREREREEARNSRIKRGVEKPTIRARMHRGDITLVDLDASSQGVLLSQVRPF